MLNIAAQKSTYLETFLNGYNIFIIQYNKISELRAAIILQDSSTVAFVGREQKAPECKNHSLRYLF